MNGDASARHQKILFAGSSGPNSSSERATFFAEREKYLLVGSSALTGTFLYAMYKVETITVLIVYQSLVYFFKSFVLAAVVALPTKLLRDDQIGSGVGMVNLGGQSAGFVATTINTAQPKLAPKSA